MFLEDQMLFKGLYSAAHDLNIEWIVIKGVSDFADGNKSETNHWRLFASVMAASLVSHTIKDSSVFESWPHFEGKCAVGSKVDTFIKGILCFKKKIHTQFIISMTRICCIKTI